MSNITESSNLNDLKRMETILDTLPDKTETETEKEARIEFLESVKRAEALKLKALGKYIDALKQELDNSGR